MAGWTRSTECFRRSYRRAGWPFALAALSPRKGGRVATGRELTKGSDYHFDVSDPFTPTPEQAPPLKDNLPNPLWGTTPLDYVIWFDKIWHTGDPSQWGPSVFTDGAVMIDVTGRSTGANIAASDFILLFKHFPALRGEVISWASNDTEIIINWRFVVSNGITVPVIDKFCFVKGLVSFRLAYFDTVMFLSYLAENYGSAQLTDYFVDRFFRMTSGSGGLLFLPKLLRALMKGIFLWTPIPLVAPTGLACTRSNGGIALRWNPVTGAKSYKVKRGTTNNGPFSWLAPTVEGTSYVDGTAVDGQTYYYVVCCNQC